jgi:CIC family chloride channel protein
MSDIAKSGAKLFGFGGSPSSRPDKAVGRSRLRIGDAPLFLVLALSSAVLSALAVVGFRIVIDGIASALRAPIIASHRESLMLIPFLAGGAIALLRARVFPTMGGNGVNQTKTAVYIDGGYTPLRSAVGKFITSSLAIGAGFSLGPEDPSLHIGAGIASFIGRMAKLPRDRLRSMVPVGAVAGLAAGFGAPISAVLFIVEEITGSWTAQTLGAAILAASAGGFIAASLKGAGPLFHIPAVVIVRPVELLAWASIGVVAGLVSVVFARGLSLLRSRLKALPRWTRHGQPAAAGLLIGVIAYLGAPEIMGAGYEVVDRVMTSQIAWQFLAALAALKILATTLSVATGTPGGLFAPTLFVGATLGGAVGGAEQALWPALSGAIGTDALVGMSALFAGFVRTPITAIFMVVEVSADYSIIVPAMIASVLAYLISCRLQPTPIFDLLGRQDGVQLPSMEHEREAVIPCVEDALCPAPAVLAGHQTVAEALTIIAEVGEPHLLVHDAAAGWRIVDRESLLTLTDLGRGDASLASICPIDGPPGIYPDHSLSSALHHLHAWPFLPVVRRTDPASLRGVLTLDAALRLYGVQTAPAPKLAPIGRNIVLSPPARGSG